MRPVRPGFPSGLRVLAAYAAALCAFAARAEPLRDGALIQALRQGGYVLVMRHASSPRTLPDQSAAQPDNVPVERELDETGRRTARAMGAAIRRLRIPIGELWSSPTYRARQTVRLAGLGDPKSTPELGDGGQGMSADTEGARSAWLRHRVTEPPRARTNTLLVTHLPNIAGAFEDIRDVADGEVLVLHPDGKGSATRVARIKIEEWPRL